jgi:hypothetical protein
MLPGSFLYLAWCRLRPRRRTTFDNDDSRRWTMASGVADAIRNNAMPCSTRGISLLTPRSPIRLLVYSGTKPLIGCHQVGITLSFKLPEAEGCLI